MKPLAWIVAAVALVAAAWFVTTRESRRPPVTSAPHPIQSGPSAEALARTEPQPLPEPRDPLERRPAREEVVAAANPVQEPKPKAVDSDEPAALPEGIRVRVLDDAGSPAADIPIGLYFRTAGTAHAIPVELKRSSDEGIAHLEKLDFNLDDIPPSMSILVGVDLPLDPKVERVLSLDELEAAMEGELLELQLPPGAIQLAGPLRVQVLDAAGEPAIGVEVGYRVQQRGAPDKGDDVASGKTTAPDGIVELDRMEEARIRAYLEGQRIAIERKLTCRGALIEAPSKLLAPEDLGKLVQLQLEPTGSLEVEVVGPDGERITEGAAVQFSWTRPGQEQRDSFEWLKLEDGAARVAHVACGMKIGLGASVRDSFFEGIGTSVPGPSKLDEVVSVTLRFEAEHPALVGRLLLPDGTPLTSGGFTLEHDYSIPPMTQNRFRFYGSHEDTDGEGRFAVPWSRGSWEDPDRKGQRMLRIIEKKPRGKRAEWFPSIAEIPAPVFEAERKRYDVGDVQLEDMPLLVAGLVVDEAGAPVPSLTVNVRYGLVKRERLEWFNHNDRPQTDEQGRFELRTHLPYERIKVYAWKVRKGSTDEQEIPVGARDVRLVYVPNEPESSRGKLRGEILADNSIPWSGLEVRIRPSGSGGGYRDAMPFAGSYRLDRVQPGTYNLELVADGHGFDGPAFLFDQLEDIVVHAGQETIVPTLDLRSQLRLYELTVLDGDGERIHRVPCKVHNPHVNHRGGWVYEGRLAFIAPADLMSVEISIGDAAPIPVTWSGVPQTITVP